MWLVIPKLSLILDNLMFKQKFFIFATDIIKCIAKVYSFTLRSKIADKTR